LLLLIANRSAVHSSTEKTVGETIAFTIVIFTGIGTQYIQRPVRV
jgi:hypothetical protein